MWRGRQPLQEIECGWRNPGGAGPRRCGALPTQSRSGDGSSAGDELQQQHDDGCCQEKPDDRTDLIDADQPQQPRDQQKDNDGPKHVFTSRKFRVRSCGGAHLRPMRQLPGPDPAVKTRDLGEFLAGYSAAVVNSGHGPTAKEHVSAHCRGGVPELPLDSLGVPAYTPAKAGGSYGDAR